MAIKILPDIPFFQNTEFIFILHTLTKVAAQAALLCPEGADQGYYCLTQLHVLLRKNLHSYDDQDHASCISKLPATNRRKAKVGDLS